MENKYLIHITNEGERWDNIAFKYYGSPFEYQRIIEANPTVKITDTLKAGIKIYIPIIETSKEIAKQGFPPWKK